MPEQSNLLIIMVDQMQAMLLDDDSPIALPSLARLRQSATRFTHAFTPAPICTPARASFQLGVPVHRHGVIGNDRAMPADMPTLADRLNRAGYQTRYVGKWHLDRGNPRGWAHFTDAHELRSNDWGAQVMLNADSPHEGVAPYGIDEHMDGRIAALAKEQWGAHAAGSQPGGSQPGGSQPGAAQPLAMMVSFFGPHAPYYLPRDWHDRFDADALPLPDTFDAPFEGKPEIQRTFRCRAWGQGWSEAKWRRIRAAYFGYVAMLDHLIGQLLDGVDLHRTAVFFVADHGESNGHLRMIYKGPMMYDTLVRIPALLHLPGQSAARDDDRLIDLTDFTATLLALAGAQHAGVEGHDLTDSRWPGRDGILSEFHEANWVKPPCKQRVAMWRDRRWKYVYNEGDRAELYDLTEAPHEVINRIDDPALAPIVTEMHAHLAQCLDWAPHNTESTRSNS
ncbi:MAG: sulfatase-like hydrolase/transferase [Phycisphaeraceae bacterium]